MFKDVSSTLNTFADIFPSSTGSALALVISAAVAVISFMTYRRSDFTLRRLRKMIAPLFELVEPTMMRNAQDPDRATVQKVTDLIASAPLLAGGKLRSFRSLTVNHLSFVREWNVLCKRVSAEYDRLSRWNNIPRRSISYRAQNYKPRFAIVPIILILAKLLLAFACMMVSFLSFLAAAQSIAEGKPEMIVPCLALSLSFLFLSWLTSR